MQSDTGAPSPAPRAHKFLQESTHIQFIENLDSHKDSFHYWTSRHLRISGIYWALGALGIVGKISQLNRDEIISFAEKCFNSTDGGYGGNEGQDSHMLYTLSAVQVLCILDAEDRIDRDAVAAWIAKRQQPDGSFAGDEWGEIDTRFTYCALNCLALLGRLEVVNVYRAADYIVSCQNWDGGFGVGPAAESHAGQIFCCVGALCIANALDRIDRHRLGFWLASRQLPSGGLNGRPEKKADVCYSWWVVSSLSMIGCLHWISRTDLFQYILLCQDVEDGGIADKPDNMPDVYHTFFGLAGLSLLGYEHVHPLEKVNPVFAMPFEVLDRLDVDATRGRNVGRTIDLSLWKN